MESGKYNWLKSMQNGSIGEARTKAFLIDRFWILERSVDVDGADFIIQAKPSKDEMLSEMPSKYGRVQAKFVQDGKTSIKVRREYVVDSDASARDDFFLFVHTGDENSQQVFLLKSKDILECSYQKNDSFYSMRLTELTRNLVVDRKLSLDRIENSIKYVSFLKNRSYIFSSLNTVKGEVHSMLPEFKENIEYWFGTLSELFIEKKEKAFEHIFRIEELHSELREFIESVDPIEASLIAQSITFKYGHEYDDIYDENLYFGGKRHLDEVNMLRQDDALDNYINGREKIEKSIADHYKDSLNLISKGSVHTITVGYNPTNLLITSIENFHSYDDSAPSKAFVVDKEGMITMSYKISVFNGKVSDGSMWLMEEILKLKYYDQ